MPWLEILGANTEAWALLIQAAATVVVVVGRARARRRRRRAAAQDREPAGPASTELRRDVVVAVDVVIGPAPPDGEVRSREGATRA